jgi:hypothetical protein
VRSGGSFPVRDISIHDFDSDHHKQDFRLGRVGGGIFLRSSAALPGWLVAQQNTFLLEFDSSLI